jgi:Fe-S cluster biogenesis protein NfuA
VIRRPRARKPAPGEPHGVVAVHGRMEGVVEHVEPVPAPEQGREQGPEQGNAPHGDAAGPGAAALGEDERRERLAQLQALMDLMRPAVQSDGGDLVLVSADVESGVVEVQLQGACSSCAISSATLQGGVERILKDRLSWVTEVIGGLTETIDPFESASLGHGAYVPRI